MGALRDRRSSASRTGSIFLAMCVALPIVAAPAGAQETICDRGDTEVRKLRFRGNQTFSDSDLEIGIVTTESSTLYRMFRIFGSRRCLDAGQLPLDVLRITSYYRERGFPSVKVRLDTARLHAAGSGRGSIEVDFVIDEGQPILIDSIAVRGLQGLADSARIMRGILSRKGSRFDRPVLGRDMQRIVAFLHNGGYPSGDVLFSFETDTLRHLASVDLEVAPGPLTRISRIFVRIDKDSVVDASDPAISEETVRRLLGFREGELVSARKLLDAQRNLFQTDVYRHVQIRPAPDSAQPDSDSLMAIEAHLVEGHVSDLRLGAGWGTLDCFRAQATYTNRSFFGNARQLELSGRVSKIGLGHPIDGAEKLCSKVAQQDIYGDTLNYRVGLTLRQPGLFGLGIRNAPSLSLYSEERSEYLAYFRSVPVGGAASVTHELRPRVRVSLPVTFSYALEYGRTQAQPAIYCALFNLCGEEERARIAQNQRLAVASVNFLRDSRDFSLDPSRGSALQFEWRHASASILSDPSLQFNTLVADYRRYWNLGGGVILSARLRGGLVLGQQLRLRVRPEGGAAEDVRVSGYVPPNERLYAGGPSSVRGFGFNELGPAVYIVSRYDTVPVLGDTVHFRARNEVRPDRSVPTGGNTLVTANVEARIPSPFLRDLVTFAIFADAGEVWNRGRTEGAAEARFDGLKITPGVGLRVFSPVGPIRVDIGYNPYARRPGAAYFDAPVGEEGIAPLYCVSPGNTLKVVPGEPGKPAVQLSGSGQCGSTFSPEGRRGLQRLTFNFSIGQAF